MRLGSLIRSEPFRAASRVLVIFLLLYGVASWALVKSVETTLMDELRSRIQVETELLGQIYRDEGRRGLVEAINRLEDASPDRAYGLFDERRLSLTGPISTQPDFLGFDTRELKVLSGGRVAGQYVLRVDRIDALTLVVGRRGDLAAKARQRLTVGLAAFGGLLAVSTLSLGLWAARRSQQRLDAMEHVLNTVSQGQLDARLDVGQGNDQFDRVARRMNANFGRLERLVSSVSSTASAIAHDLKTPLTHAQIAMQEAAEAVPEDGIAHEKVGAALAATDNLNRLFETFLRLSRIQTTKDRSHFIAVPLRDVADKAVAFLLPLVEQAGQTLTLSGAAPIIDADPDMIQQAVVNLVENACLHSGAGATIEVVLGTKTGKAFLTVRDTGPGIPDATLDVVREPFMRGAPESSASGHGLGLTIVSAIADLHEAELALKNSAHGFEATLIFPKTDTPARNKGSQ